jgi:diaminopimelate decarboxylase
MIQKRFKVRDILDGKRASELITKYGSPLYVYSENIIKKKA